MLIFKKKDNLQKHLKNLSKSTKSIGYVPTMGALHQGHISLIKKSKKECKLTVCSIFVNPTQFNDVNDFQKYPITIEKDIELLAEAGCDILFLPFVTEIYPQGLENKKPIDFGFLAQTLEGEYRKGHFEGMAQVVERLLRIVEPNFLYMGLKDYQQQLIVAQLIKKQKLRVKLKAEEIVREKNGLAMSSRNVRLSETGKKTAAEILKTLKAIKKKLYFTSIKNLEEYGRKKLQSISEIETEYFEIRNGETLKRPQDNLKVSKKNKTPLVALVAAKIEGVRLIDNMQLN